MEQPGLDNRHRDKNGRIAQKHGNTLSSFERCARSKGARFAKGKDENAKFNVVRRAVSHKASERLGLRRGQPSVSAARLDRIILAVGIIF
jgi:hypothetical protein